MKSRPARPSDAPPVQELLRANGLEEEFVAREFRVLEVGGTVVACGRMKPLPDGAAEIASVAVVEAQRGKGFGDIVTRDLLEQRPAGQAVFALALAPGFFARHGFMPVALESLPPSLVGKARGICASKGFVAMRRA